MNVNDFVKCIAIDLEFIRKNTTIISHYVKFQVKYYFQISQLC